MVPGTPPGHLTHKVLPQGVGLQVVSVRGRSRSRSPSCGRWPGWVGAGQHALRLRGAVPRVPGQADLAHPAHHLGLHTLALPGGHNHQAGVDVTQY